MRRSGVYAPWQQQLQQRHTFMRCRQLLLLILCCTLLPSQLLAYSWVPSALLWMGGFSAWLVSSAPSHIYVQQQAEVRVRRYIMRQGPLVVGAPVSCSAVVGVPCFTWACSAHLICSSLHSLHVAAEAAASSAQQFCVMLAGVFTLGAVGFDPVADCTHPRILASLSLCLL